MSTGSPGEGRSPAVREAIAELVRANRILARFGVIDAFGHVSVRHPEMPDRYLMARSLGPQLVTAADIVEFNLDNTAIDANGRWLYAERYIHGCIYQLRPDVGAVCHSHSHSIIPFGVTQVPLRPVFHMAAGLGGPVPVWDIRQEFGDTNMLVTRQETGLSLARALGQGPAILMRGHGGVVAQANLQPTVFTSIYLQINAQILQQALALGAPILLNEGETALAGEHMKAPLALQRAWQTWCDGLGLTDSDLGLGPG